MEGELQMQPASAEDSESIGPALRLALELASVGLGTVDGVLADLDALGLTKPPKVSRDPSVSASAAFAKTAEVALASARQSSVARPTAPETPLDLAREFVEGGLLGHAAFLLEDPTFAKDARNPNACRNRIASRLAELMAPHLAADEGQAS